ncbi:MAG: LVIVD repeat-containing protein [Bacteroidia bacterium]
MHHSTKFLALVLLTSLSLTGCLRDKCDMSFTHARYTPVYMSQEAFERAVEVQSPQAVQNPGKIYVKDNYLFVNEIAKGIHIYDYKNPSNPQAVAFINVPGNYDIAVNCGKLYLDSSKDLLVFDLNDVSSPALVNRVKNAMPNITQYRGYVADPSKGVVVDWTRDVVTESYNCETGIPALWEANEVDPSEVENGSNNTRSINPATPGIAGSMSRFALADDHLYVVTPSEMRVFDANNCDAPSLVRQIDLFAGEAEMITTAPGLILVGGTNGVDIFDSQDPSSPSYLSRYEHVTACDPVIIDGNFGYLTLRNGRGERCGQNFTNQLDVIDFSNPRTPNTLTSFPMTNPHGLGKDGNLLFIADGSAGLRVFDAENPMRIGGNEIAHFPNMNGYDVIPAEGTLILVGENGISLYDYSDVKNIKLLSSISVE